MGKKPHTATAPKSPATPANPTAGQDKGKGRSKGRRARGQQTHKVMAILSAVTTVNQAVCRDDHKVAGNVLVNGIHRIQKWFGEAGYSTSQLWDLQIAEIRKHLTSAVADFQASDADAYAEFNADLANFGKLQKGKKGAVLGQLEDEIASGNLSLTLVMAMGFAIRKEICQALRAIYTIAGATDISYPFDRFNVQNVFVYSTNVVKDEEALAKVVALTPPSTLANLASFICRGNNQAAGKMVGTWLSSVDMAEIAKLQKDSAHKAAAKTINAPAPGRNTATTRKGLVRVSA